MSTTFPFTIPRRLALSTGLKLIEWARRPEATAAPMTVTANVRRLSDLRRLAHAGATAEQREHDVDRYLSEVRQIL